jgi:hypothetical protein
MKSTTTTKSFLALGAGIALAAAPAHAAGVSQLGILDTSGTNPATGSEWQVGDNYHLLYITTDTFAATSTAIADYNAFVQGDANSQTGPFGEMGTVSWTALGSTLTVNAIDNTPITGPVMNAADSMSIATDAADMWDFLFDNPRTNLAGEQKNIWTGSTGGGVADTADELGATDGTTRRHWSGWTNWIGADAEQNNVDSLEMIGISEQLTVVPEPATAALFGLGSLALLRRRRK